MKQIAIAMPLMLLTAAQISAQETAVLRLTDNEDQIIQIQTKVRHTTVIVLPAKENILDFVVGDSEYWHLTGAANLAFLKPIAEGVNTNVALVSESGRIYSFLVAERKSGQPHLVVRIERPVDDDSRISSAAHEPAFVSRDRVAAYQQMAQQAAETARAAKQDAAARIAEIEQQTNGKVDAFRADYPTRLKFPYRLDKKAMEWPFLVEGMWHDGRFTYLALQRPGVSRALRTQGRQARSGGLRSDRGWTLYCPPSTRRRLVADRQEKSRMAIRAARAGAIKHEPLDQDS